MTSKQLQRLSEKMHRLAYDLEHDASRLQAAHHECAADLVLAARDVREIAEALHQ